MRTGEVDDEARWIFAGEDRVDDSFPGGYVALISGVTADQRRQGEHSVWGQGETITDHQHPRRGPPRQHDLRQGRYGIGRSGGRIDGVLTDDALIAEGLNDQGMKSCDRIDGHGAKFSRATQTGIVTGKTRESLWRTASGGFGPAGTHSSEVAIQHLGKIVVRVEFRVVVDGGGHGLPLLENGVAAIEAGWLPLLGHMRRAIRSNFTILQ